MSISIEGMYVVCRLSGQDDVESCLESLSYLLSVLALVGCLLLSYNVFRYCRCTCVCVLVVSVGA